MNVVEAVNKITCESDVVVGIRRKKWIEDRSALYVCLLCGGEAP